MKKQAVVPTYPSQSFRIPGKIRADFEVVERWLQNQAHQHDLSISQVVESLLLLANREVRARRVQFPEFSRCRRNPAIAEIVEIPESERASLLPVVYPPYVPRSQRPKPPPTRTVSYRIAPNVALWVRRMANDYYAIGEMLLILLSHSMTAIQEGRAQLNVKFSIDVEPITNTPASNGSEE